MATADRRITPGNPDGSLLVQALKHQNEPKMPPEGKLPAEAIALVEAWIKMGAPWPDGQSAAAWHTTPAPRREALGLSADHQAGAAARSQTRPGRNRRSTISFWPGSNSRADSFARGRSAHDGSPRELRPAGPAAHDPRSGTFAADPNPLAAGQLAERLLASPSYGERWARHWLDVARYADSKGYVFTEDRNYPNAYTLSRLGGPRAEQRLAVRRVSDPADRRRPLAARRTTSAPLAAMGFLTVGRRFLNNPHDIIDDRIDVLTRGTMALTVTCARCHDHKYDPIPTKDYYSLYGVLASSVEPKEPADVMTLADAAAAGHAARVRARQLGQSRRRSAAAVSFGPGRRRPPAVSARAAAGWSWPRPSPAATIR